MLQKHNSLIQDFYFEFVDVWKSFCEAHSELFNLTCDEYSALLSSDIEKLENIIILKEASLNKTKEIEQKRLSMVKQLSTMNKDDLEINSVSDLIDFFKSHPVEAEEKILFKYNLLLIDIIERIKTQNKRNQLFLNRSIITLKEINDGIRGNKSFKTYNSHGFSSTHKSD